jgi:hypothetical protein
VSAKGWVSGCHSDCLAASVAAPRGIYRTLESDILLRPICLGPERACHVSQSPLRGKSSMEHDSDAKPVDDLAPAKGIIFSVLIGLAFWAVTIALFVMR